MIYATKNKPIITELRKTYTEDEEMQYSNIRKRPLSKFTVLAMFLAVCFMFCGSVCASNIFTHTHTQWDGAGDTWTCSNCGASNYCWEMTCSSCGKS